jgi:hypothetical protein
MRIIFRFPTIIFCDNAFNLVIGRFAICNRKNHAAFKYCHVFITRCCVISHGNNYKVISEEVKAAGVCLYHPKISSNIFKIIEKIYLALVLRNKVLVI